jgi:hypothetical protein
VSSSASASGGSFRYADGAEASVTVTFTGTYLAWITKQSAVYGVASVSLDGAGPVTVDLCKATTAWQQKVWETGVLPAGTHTVTIAWTGDKNAAATGTSIGADAFDLLGTLTAQTASTPVASPVMLVARSAHTLAPLVIPPWDQPFWLSPTGWAPSYGGRLA